MKNRDMMAWQIFVAAVTGESADPEATGLDCWTDADFSSLAKASYKAVEAFERTARERGGEATE